MADGTRPEARSTPPGPTPISASGRLGTLVVVAVATAIVAFGLGYRAASPGPTATPLSLPSPSPPDVRAGTVSDRLRVAYRAVGTGWATCTLAAAPRCTPLNHELYGLAADPRMFAPSIAFPDWESLGPRQVGGPRLVVVADLHADAAMAFLAGMGTPASASPPAEVQLVPIADRDGTFYFDTGTLAPGRYVVVVAALAAFDPSAPRPPFGASAAPSGWWTYQAAFEVV